MQDPDRRAPAQRGTKLHVAALLEREGHPLKAEVSESGGGVGRGKIVGIAAGTMLVAGAVAASALGLNSSAQSHHEAGGVPVPGAAGHGAAGGVSEYPAEQVDNQLPSDQDAAPQTTAPQSAPATQARPAPAAQQHVTPHKTHHSSSSSSSSSSSTSTPAPQQQDQQPQQQTPPQDQQPQQQQGGLGKTLQDVVTPVTQTLDDTLSPALSMIPVVGGLLGG